MRPILRLVVLAMSLLLWLACGASAAALHPVGDFDQPIFITSDPADPNELFVAEREGRVMRVAGGATSAFADLTDLVACCVSERGLLSIALAPDFDASGRFYAAYTGKPAAGGAEGDIHIDAFRDNAGVRQREPILTIGHAVNANHNGGQLAVGPDGYLYISTGDGGGGGDPFESGQSLDTLLGKILRLNPQPGAEAEIWSYGLRNPWRFSFDRQTGDMVIADVGQSAWEEIDFAPSPATGVVGGSGANYGWNCREGFAAYPQPGTSCAGAGAFTDPVFAYPHADPENGEAHGCAVTGGYVVRDPSLGDLYSRYVYADFCVGEIRSLILPTNTGAPASDDRSEGLSVTGPVSFGEDSCGRIYVVSQGGPIYRLEGPTPASCPVASVARSTAAVTQAVSTGATRVQESHRAQLELRVQGHRRQRALKLTLTARATPCAGLAGSAVQLNQGGQRIASKRLSPRCIARFRLTIDRRSTFRALGPLGSASGLSRSSRLVVSIGGHG